MFRKIRSAMALSLLLVATTAVPVFAAVPDNDEIGSPLVVGSVPYTNAQDVTEATTGASDPDCFGTGPTVWYEFTPGESGWYQADTFASDYDTTLYLGIADGAGGIELLRCNDDAGSTVQSRIALELEGGVTYLYMVGAYANGPGGNLVFNLDSIEAPVPLEMFVSIDPKGKFLRDGSARISGTVRCSADAFGYLSVELRQSVGRFTILGYAGVEIECTTAGSPWEVTISGITGKFAGGAATVNLYGEAFVPDKEEWASVFQSATVRLVK